MAERIDCLQTAITYLASDADIRLLTGGQVASRHKFALAPATNAWPAPSKALTLSYDPGATPDMYALTEQARLDVRCWGETPEEAQKVYNRLMAICDTFIRSEVHTDNGLALLYQLDPVTSARSDRDPDTHVDFIQCFVYTSVHRDPL
jgi:hypothetical protein